MRARSQRFFREMLGDVTEPVLAFGLNDVRLDGADTTESRQRLPAALNRRLRAQAARLGVSLASLCHLGWALVLSRSSHCEQGVFGTVLLGRSGAESEDMVGLLINTLPVRVDINGTGAQEAVRAVHARLGALLAHEQATLSAGPAVQWRGG
nr:hypothetical protein SYMBAF_70003 [Serratia symbiotica]